MQELVIEARKENMDEVLSFIDGILEEKECSMKAQMQIDVAVEELFVNIASYAYAPSVGKATLRVEFGGDPLSASITFIDQGVPYDPLAKEDPDVTLSAEEREIGGLGIYMVKKSMDKITYEYKDGSNVLTIWKKIS